MRGRVQNPTGYRKDWLRMSHGPWVVTYTVNYRVVSSPRVELTGRQFQQSLALIHWENSAGVWPVC